MPHGPELVEVQGVCGGCAMALQTGCNASEEIVSQLARSLCRPSNTTGADGHNWFNALLKTVISAHVHLVPGIDLLDRRRRLIHSRPWRVITPILFLLLAINFVSMRHPSRLRCANFPHVVRYLDGTEKCRSGIFRN